MQRISSSMIATIAAGVLFAAGIGVAAQEHQPAPPHKQEHTQGSKAAGQPQKQVMVNPDDLKWGPGPAGLPPGLQMAVLEGNPEKPGRFTVRVKMPDNYMVPPHSHPTEEQLTVLSGTLMAGAGTKADEKSMHALKAAAYAVMPAHTNHYVHSKGETVLQISSRGPFAIKYVNPSDDPRKKTTARK